MKSQPLFLLNDTIIRRIQGVIYFSTRCWRNQKFCKRFVQHCNLMSQQMLQIHLSFSFTPGMFTLTIQKPSFCFANLWKLHGLETIFSKNMSDSFQEHGIDRTNYVQLAPTQPAVHTRTHPGRQVAIATTLYTVTPPIWVLSMSPFRRLEFQGGAQTFRKYAHPCYMHHEGI